MQIAKAAVAAFGDFGALAIMGEVGNDLLGRQILDDGTDRYAQRHVIGTTSGAACAAALFAVFGAKNPCEPVINERIDVFVGHHINAAAASAIAAVGPAFGDIFFTPHRCRAASAITGVDFNTSFVDKFHLNSLAFWPRYANAKCNKNDACKNIQAIGDGRIRAKPVSDRT